MIPSTPLVVVLDAGPLGMASNPRSLGVNAECVRWLQGRVRQGIHIIIPEISDYEVRRELLRANRTAGIGRLDWMCERFAFERISTPAMRQAAENWAIARQQGIPSAPDSDLDADMILCGMVTVMKLPSVVIATTNARHLSRFCPAKDWREIV